MKWPTVQYYCPTCKCVLVLDEPHQSDVDGYCAFCNFTWNIDWHDVTASNDDEPCPQWFIDIYNKHFGDI